MAEPIDDTEALQLNDVGESGGNNKQASQGDILGLTDVGGGFSPLAELWNMPPFLHQWGVRARFETMEDINAIVEMISEDQVLMDGYCNYTSLHYLQQTFRLGLEGRARDEMLSGMHAATNRESQKWGGFLGKLFGKSDGGGPADRGNPVKE
jgi:hypothetical protein